MEGWAFAMVERLHGHLGVLALALLLHPVISLKRRAIVTVWTRRTAEIAAGLLAITFAAGWWLYPTYRSAVKPSLLDRAPDIAARFETKEHLAFCALCLAVGGALTLRAAGRTAEGRSAAWALLLASWLCGLATAGLGVIVAARAHPGW